LELIYEICILFRLYNTGSIQELKVAEKLDIELVDIDDFACCGFPMKAGDQISSEVMAAYNLSIAQEKGLSICTLCSSCASALSEAAHHLAKNDLAREKVNKELSKVGLLV
jgi:heterodisulfide reductase subunit B